MLRSIALGLTCLVLSLVYSSPASAVVDLEVRNLTITPDTACDSRAPVTICYTVVNVGTETIEGFNYRQGILDAYIVA